MSDDAFILARIEDEEAVVRWGMSQRTAWAFVADWLARWLR